MSPWQKEEIIKEIKFIAVGTYILHVDVTRTIKVLKILKSARLHE